MQTRNAIIVLDKIRLSFPIIRNSGEILEKMAKDIELSEGFSFTLSFCLSSSERGDLKQLARSYHAKLQSCKENWIPLHRFSSLSAAEVRSGVLPNQKFNVDAKVFIPIRISTKQVSSELSILSATSASTPMNNLVDQSQKKVEPTIIEKKSAALLSKYTKVPHTNDDLEAKRILVKSTLESKIDKEKKLNEHNKLATYGKKTSIQEIGDLRQSKNFIGNMNKNNEFEDHKNGKGDDIANTVMISKSKQSLTHEDGEVKEPLSDKYPRNSSRAVKSNDQVTDPNRGQLIHSSSDKKEVII